ncbi:glutamate-5-semialdehyde dehydrogenase [Candidatus Peregrinibacteria bacterium]|nr:glutamate-5-semialdehyde dehydrogenase [Candidatus Peregrinibacteria bacterium]
MKNLQKKFAEVKTASLTLAGLSENKINKILKDLAANLLKNKNKILLANKKDLSKMDSKNPKYDRLLLNEDRLKSIACDLNNVAKLSSNIGEILEQKTMPNGLQISKVRVPLGVIAVIYEARPNVTIDVFSLCFKSKNCCILKGGSEAENSNAALVKTINQTLSQNGVDSNLIFLMPNDRELVKGLLTARNFIDVIIPRGGQSLIDFVVENAKVPVIETGAGIVHTYIDESADPKQAAKIIFNAKTRRVGVCNALDTLIIHQKQLKNLYAIVNNLAEKNVEIFADAPSFKVLKKYPFLKNEENFGTEFLDYKMSIKTVKNLDEALAHIAAYSSKHSEAIISTDNKNIEKFLNSVDAACVYANTSTAFSDGAQFGLGAEIGISTQKLHARGPMALRELTTYKWIVRGSGQTRN